ncbi:MAG: lipopolysaccharide export system protein LptA [Motiliproteus sp.]|jgi:lipopolysaccharide export system protein LptA
MNPINRCLLLAGCVLFTLPCWALPQDKLQAIEISADSAEIDDSRGTATYSGNVKLIQGSLRLDADDLTLHTDNNGDVQLLVAKGRPAHFQQQHQIDAPVTHGYGQTIEFDIQLDLLTLTEQAKLLRADDSFRGKRIQVDTTKNVIQAFSDKRQPDSRVQMIIKPRVKTSAAAASITPAPTATTTATTTTTTSTTPDAKTDSEDSTQETPQP